MSARAPLPRFDIHRDAGEVWLALVEPLELPGGGSLDRLEIGLGRFDGRLDLRAGVERFRHRRGSLVSARFSSSLRQLEAWAASHGVALSLSVEGALALSVDFGESRLSLRVEVDGGALILRPVEPLTPLARDAARELGLCSTSDGALRVDRPLRSLLIRALASRGWRVPDERGCTLSVEMTGDAFGLVLRRVV